MKWLISDILAHLFENIFRKADKVSNVQYLKAKQKEKFVQDGCSEPSENFFFF